MPKSLSFGSRKRETRTLAGLRSRCRMPARCAVSSAPATVTATSSTSGQGSGPSRASRSASEPPDMRSITM
ncbi:hypothetical protein BJF78_26795 [Pseudonocardia sp. CNS-139]|nr:hypothetical protein BJF78_26795 [Pseudonocardia sp. CNS-139]